MARVCSAELTSPRLVTRPCSSPGASQIWMIGVIGCCHTRPQSVCGLSCDQLQRPRRSCARHAGACGRARGGPRSQSRRSAAITSIELTAATVALCLPLMCLHTSALRSVFCLCSWITYTKYTPSRPRCTRTRPAPFGKTAAATAAAPAAAACPPPPPPPPAARPPAATPRARACG